MSEVEAVEFSDAEIQVIVQAFDVQTTVEEFSFDDVNEFYVEHGGLHDVAGQLATLVMDFVEEVTSALETAIRSAIDSIYNSLKGALDTMSQTLQGAISGLQDLVSGAIETITASLQSLGEQLTSFVNSITSAIQSGFTSLQNAIGGIVSEISKVVGQIQSAISGIASQIGSVVQSAISGLYSFIRGIASNIQATISGFVQTVTSAVSSLIAQIQSLASSISGAIQNAFTSIQTFFKGVINNIVATMQSIVTQVQSGFTSLATYLSNIPTFIQNATQSVVNFVSNIPSQVYKHLKPILDPIINKIKDIPKKMAEISKAFQGFVNPLVSIKNFFESIQRGVKEFVDKLPDFISRAWESFVSYWSSLPEKVKTISDAIGGVVKFLEDVKDKFIDFVTSIPEKIKDLASAISGVGEFLSDVKDKFIDFVTSIPEKIGKIGEYIYDNAIKPFQDWIDENIIEPIGKHVKDFAKKVADFLGWITEGTEDFIKDPIGAVATFLNEVWQATKDAISGFANSLIDLSKGLVTNVVSFLTDKFSDVFGTVAEFFANVGSKLADAFWNLIKKITEAGTKVAEKIGKETTQILEKAIKPVIDGMKEPLEKAFESTISKLKQGKKVGQIAETVTLLGVALTTLVSSQFFARGLQIFFRKIAGILSGYKKTFTIRVRGKGEGKGEPAGVGAGASAGAEGGYTYDMSIRLDYPFLWLSNELIKYPDILGRAMIYGGAIWLSQPLMRLANAMWRNMLPVELPTVTDMTKITRRFMPIEEKFKEHIEKMRHYLAMYGYNDDVVSWLTTTAEEKGWFITVKDRFSQDRIIPISLLYELPTPSELCRMMIHDIFTPPEAKTEEVIGNFTKIMKMKGYVEDIAFLYYLLHYKYPSLEKLWEFSCRATAGLAWVTAESEQFKWAGKQVGGKPTSPASLNVKIDYSKAEDAIKRIPDSLNAFINKYLRHYAKWHDYAPFSWLDGFTADNLIMLDLMADIPMRIDTRWMYKWGIIPDYEVLRIVVARGMHPKWVKNITIAECMNALAEERTYARTGIISTFKEGFMDLENLNKTLSHLTDVTILGENVPVKFLEGEVKLLSLRAKYDRALDILRDYFKDLLRAVTENIYSFNNMTESLKKETEEIGKGLDLKALKLDEEYFKLYKPVAETLRNVRTIERIRYWYRYMLYRILYRFSEGYMTEEELGKIIDDIVKNARLTEQEKQVFKTIAELMFDGFKRKIQADAILNKVKRGVIDPSKAVDELTKIGLDKSLAEALIEKYAKIYTLSISQLMSYAEYVDIPEDFVKKKLEYMGVPKDEVPIILQVFKIRPLKDERAKAIRTVIDSFVDGYIDEKTLKSNLEKLGKSKREIDLLMEYAKYEKDSKVAKLKVDAILNRLRRGVLKLEDAKKELEKIIVDKALIDAIIDKYVRTSVWTPDKLISMGEYVPIDIDKVVERAKEFGYPDDEVKLYKAYLLARNLNEEIGRVVNELVYLYVYGGISEDELRKKIDEVRTLKGKVKDFGVDWIVIDDNEKELIIERAKLRKMREELEQQT